ncbi:MAG: sarcosine oxidase subunit gamma family protein [Deltaproteobacteria bacterium]
MTHSPKTDVSRATPRAMLSLRSRRFDTSLKDDLTRATMVAFPAPLTISQTGEIAIAWMATDELLILCPEERRDVLVASIKGASDGADLLITDVSDIRMQFTLSGGPLREVLARITPADVSQSALPVGMFRRSMIGQIAAAFWFSAPNQAQVLCFRSVGDYVEDVLKNAAAYATPLGLYES